MGRIKHGESLVSELVKVQFRPEAIVDVGANSGGWALGVKKIFPNATMLLVEASEQHEASLTKLAANQQNTMEYRIALLSSRPNQTIPFFAGGDTGNSMFQEDTRFYKNDKPVSKTTFTLDQLLQDSIISRQNKTVDFLKVDVQGAELVVLEGSHQVLDQATFVMLEISNTQYNIGGACEWQLRNLLHRYGFVFYAFGDVMSGNLFKTHGVGQYNALYVKPTSPRFPKKLNDLNGTYCPLVESRATTTRSTAPADWSGLLMDAAYGRDIRPISADALVAFPSHVFVAGVVIGMILSWLFCSRRCSKRNTK